MTVHSIGHVRESSQGSADDFHARAPALARLSPREVEVLAAASQGLTNAQIALQLGVTVHAVKFHLAAVYRKIGTANRTESANLFIRAQQDALQH
jgi:DNA-binding CsgD family transcriptional regulator